MPTVTWNQPLKAAFEPVDLGPYRLESRLGAGGFATVFKAISRGELGFERVVAVKLLHPGIIERSPGMTRALADEARLLGRIRHPNIVAAQWFGQLQPEDGEPVWAIVMDYVEGKSWRELLHRSEVTRRQLPHNELYDVHLALARGLAYAHSLTDEDGEDLGLVHRDLKPENVMISSQGEVKLLDFGIAKVRDRLADTTDSGNVRGTVAYMSPEQVHGKDIDFRSDYFALGTMLYEGLTNVRLFRAKEPVVSMYRIAHLKLDDVLLPLQRVAPEAVSLLERLLHPDREQRYADGAELVGALERLRGSADSLASGHSALARRVSGQPNDADVAAATWNIDDEGTDPADPDASTAQVPELSATGHAAIGAKESPGSVPPTPDAPAPDAPTGGELAPRRGARWLWLALVLGVAAGIFALFRPPGPGRDPLPSPTIAPQPSPLFAPEITPAPTPGSIPATTPATTPGPSPATTPATTLAPTSTPRPDRTPTTRPEPSPASIAPPATSPRPAATPSPSATPTPTAATQPDGPPGVLQVAVPLSGRWELHVGGRAFDALAGRRGVSLAPGSYTVELRCHADCPAGERVRTWDVTLGPGERKKLRL